MTTLCLVLLVVRSAFSSKIALLDVFDNELQLINFFDDK
jgi:hypothetical protein